MSVEDLEAVVSHVAASLKKIFPDSSPGWVTSLQTTSGHKVLYYFVTISESYNNIVLAVSIFATL